LQSKNGRRKEQKNQRREDLQMKKERKKEAACVMFDVRMGIIALID
jgi:hypothetical protein